MDVQIQTGWDNDPAGRIRNLSLAPNAKNSLFPLFEAVMNSIHAVEDRFGKDNLSKGEVSIELHRTDSGEMEGFTVSDNGIGFNEPPPLYRSTAMFRKRRTRNGKQTTKARRDRYKVASS